MLCNSISCQVIVSNIALRWSQCTRVQQPLAHSRDVKARWLMSQSHQPSTVQNFLKRQCNYALECEVQREYPAPVSLLAEAANLSFASIKEVRLSSLDLVCALFPSSWARLAHESRQGSCDKMVQGQGHFLYLSSTDLPIGLGNSLDNLRCVKFADQISL